MYNALNEQIMFQAMEDRTSRIVLRKWPRRRRTRTGDEAGEEAKVWRHRRRAA